MIEKCADYIAFYLVKNGLIEQDKMAIYKYGYEILISNIINISVALIVGAIFSEFIESIIFLMVFAIMRKYCGGYHANTYLKCEIIFFLNTVCIMILAKTNIHLELMWLYAIYLFIIEKFAPIKNKYKPIDSKRKWLCKLYAIILCASFNVFLVLNYKKSNRYSMVVDLTLLSVVLSMIIQKILTGRRRQDET